MALQLPNMPNYNVTPPQVANPMEQYGKMLQLKMLSGQAALQPLQMQEAQQDLQAKTLKNQETQLALDSQQALIKAVGSGFLTKYAGSNASPATGAGPSTGFDANG